MSIQVKYNYFQVDADRNRATDMKVVAVMDEGHSSSCTPVWCSCRWDGSSVCLLTWGPSRYPCDSGWAASRATPLRADGWGALRTYRTTRPELWNRWSRESKRTEAVWRKITQPCRQVHSCCWYKIYHRSACSRRLTCSVDPGWPPSVHVWVRSTGSSPLRPWLCALWRRIPPLASVRACNGPGRCRRRSVLSRNQEKITYIYTKINMYEAMRVDCPVTSPIIPLTDWATCLCMPASMKSSSRSSARNNVVKAHKWAPAEWPISTILSCKRQWAEHRAFEVRRLRDKYSDWVPVQSESFPTLSKLNFAALSCAQTKQSMISWTIPNTFPWRSEESRFRYQRQI